MSEVEAVVASKPRLTYQQFVAAKQHGTVASTIRRFIVDSEQPGAKPLGLSHGYTLKRLARSPIGELRLEELKPQDFLDHCRMRKADGIQPQTTNQDITYLSGVLKHAVQVWDVPEGCLSAYKKAQPLLVKQQLIAKSTPRTRRPTPEEIELLLAFYDKQAEHKNTKIPMRAIVEFSLKTARRISETCRILWDDLDHEKRLCLVRDLKNPKGKGFHDSFPLLGDAWDLVIAQPRVSARIFPFCAKSCGASYTRAKKKLAALHPGLFINLRLHDNRREKISRMFEEGYSVPEVAKLSLHRNPHLLLRVYTALKPEDLHKGPASKRAAA